MDNEHLKSNKYYYGLGTIGRDMAYTLVSMYLIVYLTEVLNLPDATMWWMTGILTVMRIFDALNDPFMGIIVDNTKSRYGKFKPWILLGSIISCLVTVLMFTDYGTYGIGYVVLFAVLYLLWDISFGANDIAYWSMLPSLTMDQKQRENLGAFARNCANIGMFAIVVAILPITAMLTETFGSPANAWFLLSIILSVMMIGFQFFTLLGVKEKKGFFKQEEITTIRGMFTAIFKNDQLLYTAISMALFMIGYTTTTSFGVYFFKYAYKDEGMYSIFAAILGVSQLAALTVFPVFSKRFTRKQLYTISTVLVVLGYIVFFFAPMNMIPIGIAGILIFIGQAFIQLLMLMFLADTIEYGQWKSGKRNESVTFSVQPFINKIGGAIANGVVGVTVIIAGINNAATPNDVASSGLLTMKLSMLVLPLLAILAGYLIYLAKFKIDKEFYENIVGDLRKRGDIK